MPTLTILLEVTEHERNTFLNRITDRAGPIPTDGLNYDPAENAEPNANPPQLDSKNMPWDERIHSASKALNADNSWRARRNVSDEVVKAVTEELRARMAAGTPAPVAAPTPEPVAQPEPVATPAAMPGGLPGMPPIVTPPVDVPVSMDTLVALFTKLMAPGGKITADMTSGIYAAAGVSDTAELATNETLRKKLHDVLMTYDV